MNSRYYYTIMLLAAMLLAATPADLEKARRLFADARVDQNQGRWGTALSKLQQVAAIKESAGVHYYMGLSYLNLGRLREAKQAFLISKEMAEKAKVPDVLAVVDTKLSEVTARMPVVFVHGSGILSVDTIDVSNLSDPIYLDPGDHTLVMRWKAGPEVTQVVHLKERDTSYITLNQPIPSPATSVSASVPLGVAPPVKGTNPWLTWGLSSAGSVLILSGGAALWQSHRIQEDTSATCVGSVICDPQRDRDRAVLNGLAVSSFILGGISLGAGLYFTLVPYSRKSSVSLTLDGVSGTF